MAIHYVVPALLIAQLLRGCSSCDARRFTRMSERSPKRGETRRGHAVPERDALSDSQWVVCESWCGQQDLNL